MIYLSIILVEPHVNSFTNNQSIQHYDIICIIYIIWSNPKEMIYLLHAISLSNPGSPMHPMWGPKRGASVKVLPPFNMLLLLVNKYWKLKKKF